MPVVFDPVEKHTASVIFLHGLGGSGDDWPFHIFKDIRLPHIKYIFPDAHKIPVTFNGGTVMNAWYDMYKLQPVAEIDKEGLLKASDILLGYVEKEIKIGIPPESIFIGGFSQGATVSLCAALRSSYRLAGVISLSGRFIMPESVVKEPCNFSEEKLKTPFLICHGDTDTIVPLASAKDGLEFLKKSGFSNVDFKLYLNMDHYVSNDEINYIDDFILKFSPK